MPNIRRPCRRGLCRSSDRRQRSRHGSRADTAGLDRPRAELSTLGRRGPRLSGRRGASVGVPGPYGRCSTAVPSPVGGGRRVVGPRGRDGVEVVDGGEGVVAGSRVAMACRWLRESRAAQSRPSVPSASAAAGRPSQDLLDPVEFFPCRGRWFRSRFWCAGRSPRCHPGSGAAAPCQCRPGEPGCRPGTGAAWRRSNG
jgi:hypothetical protein